jgi:hypothetical protein
MGQVPAFSSFLVVGNGRLARHLRRYFELEALPFYLWSRKSSANLPSLLAKSSHVLLAISDGALQPFIDALIDENPLAKQKTIVHFSGTLTLPDAPSAHPLMTFAADRLYDLATYRKTPFVLEKSRSAFAELLPGLKNPHYEIEPALKGLYHALCSLSGNFTTLLWEKAFDDFSSKLGLPKEAILPYLHQVADNLAAAPAHESVLTGPLVRGDNQTIEKHLNELNNDPYRDVYMAFTQAYRLTTAQGGTK